MTRMGTITTRQYEALRQSTRSRFAVGNHTTGEARASILLVVSGAPDAELRLTQYELIALRTMLEEMEIDWK